MMLVRVKPGAMALTRTCVDDKCTDADLTIWLTAALADAVKSDE